jgi:hypothetical protein
MTLQNVMLPVPTRRRMTRILSGRGPMIATSPQYSTSFAARIPSAPFFPIGEAMPGLHIAREVVDNRFAIGGGSPMGRVSWEVAGVRHDPYILAHPIIVEVPKGPDQIVNKGECLFEPLCQ